MPIIIDARNMGGGSIGSAAGGDTSTGTRNNVMLAAPWDESKEYLKGDLATDNGDLYQAQKSVPAGVKIIDEDYWRLVVAGDKAGETEKLKENIGNFDDLETESKDNLVAAINEVSNIRPDWNQNDETKKDYVKGRTHWAYKERKTLYENKAVDLSSTRFVKIDGNPFSLEEGKTYTVVWDGVEYEAVCKIYNMNSSSTYLGNVYWGNKRPNDDTGEPFYIGDNLIYGERGSGTHSISLIEEVERVRTLDPKYLPQKQQPDWNENDDSADGYIKNRPFYTEEQKQTYDKTVDMSESKYVDAGLSDFTLYDGQKYLINWDGKEYESVCETDYGTLHIGNFALYDRAPFSKADTGEPFCVFFDGVKNQIVGEKTGASHRIILTYGIPTIHMLSPRYIGVKSKEVSMTSDEGYVKYLTTPDGNYELVVPEISDLRECYDDVKGKRLAEFRVTRAQMDAIPTSEYTEINCDSYDSHYNRNNVNSYYVSFYIDDFYNELLPGYLCGNYIYFVFATKQGQTYCLRADPSAGGFKIKRLNLEILDSITGIVTADKLTSPDHPTDLVAYEAFQAAVPMVQQMNITGATVGQTIKVKTVDATGRPTSWEAADMGGGNASKLRWQKVNEITTTEQTNSITLTKDSNGVDISEYNAIAIKVEFAIPADSTQTDNHGSVWVYPYVPYRAAIFRVITTVANWKTIQRNNMLLFFGDINGMTYGGNHNGGLVANTEADKAVVEPLLFNGITLYINVGSTTNHFPVGTIVSVEVLSDRE